MLSPWGLIDFNKWFRRLLYVFSILIKNVFIFYEIFCTWCFIKKIFIVKVSCTPVPLDFLKVTLFLTLGGRGVTKYFLEYIFLKSQFQPICVNDMQTSYMNKVLNLKVFYLSVTLISRVLGNCLNLQRLFNDTLSFNLWSFRL